MKFSRIFLSILIITVINFSIRGQESNIYTFDYTQINDELELSNATILTAFNASGINHSPTFLEDDVMLISTNFFEKDQQDIVKLDLKSQELTRLTHTSDSETFPSAMSGDQFSVLLETGRGNSIHSYPLDLSHAGKTIYDRTEDINGYEWQPNKQTMFIKDASGNVSSLDMNTYEKSILLNNVHSRILIDKYQNILLAQRETTKTSLLKKYDRAKKKYKTYGRIENGSYIIGYLPNHKIVAASGSKLYLFNLVSTSIWEEVADLAEYGIDTISDLIIKDEILIVVAEY